MAKRNLTVSGFDDVVKSIKNQHDRRFRRKKLTQLLGKIGNPVKTQVKKNTPIYTGKNTRFKTTKFKHSKQVLFEMQLRLSAGTLKKSMKVFKGKKTKNPKVFVGARVTKRPKSFRQWVVNSKKWGNNGWYGTFLIHGTKGNTGAKGGIINSGIKKNDFLDKTMKTLSKRTKTRMKAVITRHIKNIQR